MPPRLKQIEIENFKSYSGRRVIGSLKPFNAVIGPNGSGKSNFMDAISFVMGEKTQSLRVKKLSDLIHGASIDKPVSRSASVTAVFILDEYTGKEIVFQRSVQGSSSEYRINNTIASNKEYLAELVKLGINVKGKNFLVFQGTVESIAMFDSKEMTALFEEISGSSALKEEYDKLKQKMQNAQEELKFTLEKKRGINSEINEAKLEKEESDKYARLKDDLNEKLVERQLFLLYHNEREMRKIENDLTRERLELQKIEKKKEKAEQVLKEKKKDEGQRSRELAEIEQKIRNLDAEISKKRPHFIKAKERVSYVQNKLDAAIKTLEQARKANEARINDIKKLEDELAQVERTKDMYEIQIAEESQSQGRDVHLEEEQIREYHRLKNEVAKRSAQYTQDLESVNREQKCDQDRFDNVSRLRINSENKHRQKCHEKEELEKRMEKLDEYLRQTEQVLQDLKQQRSDLESDLGSSRDRVLEIQKQLDNVLEQLADARIDKHEDIRRKNKLEILERLKKYPGVYDRMINLCQPTHRKYNIAITKVMGKYMEAIVVDNEQTAINCIQFLKEQRLDFETFLPLTYLKPQPVKEKLRNITDPKNVKLLYDVVQFESQDYAPAVLFATKNVLVCETSEDAMRVAYELSDRYDAVALDGTFYQKSGLISGGTLDLERKAKRWDEKYISKLKAQRDKLTKELKEAMMKSRKEWELNIVKTQIQGLEVRLRCVKNDKDSTMKQIKAADDEIRKLSDEMVACRTEQIGKTMQTREQQIKEVKLQMNRIEDDVFSEFCEQIGIRNIRQYEDRELLVQEERKQKRLELKNQIDRITSNLEFERNRDTLSNVTRWECIVDEEQTLLETCRKQEQNQKEEINKDLQQMEQLKSQCLNKQKEIDVMVREVSKARKEVGSLTKDVQNAQSSIILLETEIEKKKNERHTILKQCKIDSTVIPLTVGSMKDTVASDPSSASSEDVSSTALQYEKEARIEIDYSSLSGNLKRLEQNEIEEMAEKLLSTIKDIKKTLTKIQATNMHAVQKLEQAQGKLKSANEEFETLRKHSRSAKVAFEKIKQQRYEKFSKCFDHVSNEIDNVYKALAQNQSAQAFLVAENSDEPYLGGINYNCVAPGKRFHPMSNLSGGEKTIAALALLFAIHSYQPAPFFVLDETDAALDNTNIGKVANYIREKAESLQIIVISLKEEFFSHADLLIGIWPQRADCLVSRIATVDLTKYDY